MHKALNFRYNLHVLVSCFAVWVFPYGLFIVAVEATSYVVFCVLTVLPIITFFLLMQHSIPQPNQSAVDEVLGQSHPENWFPTGASRSPSPDPKEMGPVLIYAHRFAGIDAPENTMEALEMCIKNGFKAVEFDIVMTSDFITVVFHDPKLDRVTGLPLDIRKTNYEFIKSLDVSKNHHFGHFTLWLYVRKDFPMARIPKFEDIVKKCIEHDIRMIIDIKEDRIEIVKEVVDMFKKYPIMYKRAFISSFDGFIVYMIRRMDPDIVGAMAWRPFYLSYCTYSPRENDCTPYHNTMFMYYVTRFEDLLYTWFFNNFAQQLLGFSAVLLSKDILSAETIRYWHEKNIRVIAWTVNSPLEKQYLSRELGLSYVTDSAMGNN